MIESILLYIWKALYATLLQILIILGPGLVLAFILNYVAGFVERRAVDFMGRGWYLGLFGWIGTAVHEVGHLIFCVIFRHKVTDVKLFDPDPKTGTLGYVEHSYDRGSLYQLSGNFFIGIGPILLGTAVIYLLSAWLLSLNPFNQVDSLGTASLNSGSWPAAPQLVSDWWRSSVRFLTGAFSVHNLSGWQFYVFIYLAFAVGSSITLSPPDIKSAFKGFLVIIGIIFIFNLATVWISNFTPDFISRSAGYSLVFYGGMFLILLLNLAVAGLILLPLFLLRSSHGRK